MPTAFFRMVQMPANACLKTSRSECAASVDVKAAWKREGSQAANREGCLSGHFHHECIGAGPFFESIQKVFYHDVFN